jgi:PII-like signaling protein
MVSVIDSAAKIETAIGAVSEMLNDGLIVLSDAEVVRVVRSLPPASPSPDKS